MAARHCFLEYHQSPDYWKNVREPLRSVEHAIQRLEETEAAYVSKRGAHLAVFIADSASNAMLIGLAGRHRVFTLLRNVGKDAYEYQYAIGDRSRMGSCPFLTPDWTEISKAQFLPKSKTLPILEAWIERGELSDCVTWTFDLP